MADTILMTGVIELDPAKRDEAIAAAQVVMEATRAEAGCEAYTFSGDFSDPGRFYVTEQWASEEAMNAHLVTPHLAKFMGKMGGFGVTKASLTRWDCGGPGTPLF